MPQQQMNEEQMKELQEKIKNMSPEELKEFQKKQCIFCQIIEGKVQSKKLYEDDKSVAILDINPANPGHVLLLPKEHYSIMPQLSEEEISHLFVVAKTISNAVLRGLGVQGTNIIVQNGIAAGQKAQHFMIHIIPRKEEDGLNFELPQKKHKEEELEEIRIQLESKLGKVEQKVKAAPKVSGLLKTKEKVVEAEFKEDDKQKEAKESKKARPEKSKESGKDKKDDGKKAKKKELKKEEEGVGLDDIANVLGVK